MKLRITENNNGKVTPKGFNYGGTYSSIDINADPIKVDKVNDKFMKLAGYDLEEAISEVADVIENLDDDYTVNYLKVQLPKMCNATITMKDIVEVADTCLR